MESTTKSRTYRSAKRNKPCNRCRSMKTRCQVIAGSQCTRCEHARVDCSLSRSEDISQMQPIERDNNRSTPVSDLLEQRTYLDAPWADNTAHSVSVGSLRTDNDAASFAQHAPAQDNLNTHFSTQISQSLEDMQGCSAHLFGTSSESDPWLWRHCKFDDFGIRFSHYSKVRNAGGVPHAQKIPIHFNIESIQLHESARKETKVPESWIHSRDELNHVVPLEYGARLVTL